MDKTTFHFATVELRTESRSVQAKTAEGHVLSVGSTRQNSEPWPQPTALFLDAMLTKSQYQLFSQTIERLFVEYERKYEGVIESESPPKELSNGPAT